ncbi:MAG: hypothetical protein U5R49_10285 [Deltaproteobacteria bacterium]|nr:hypothetical protein [Deltaproteobacteria bacterium]
MEKLKEELALYERRFGMNSQGAWVAYQKGELGDDGDIMEWMMLFENYRALERQNDRLSQIDTLQLPATIFTRSHSHLLHNAWAETVQVLRYDVLQTDEEEILVYRLRISTQGGRLLEMRERIVSSKKTLRLNTTACLSGEPLSSQELENELYGRDPA